MPEISIIVPVYNVEKYLNRCIDSILAQTFTDFELVLVDDGSTDRCSEICDNYARRDSRIRVIHKENGGVSKARNDGIKQSRGKFLAFCDSDDYLDKHYLTTLYDTMINQNCDCVSVGYKEVDDYGTILRNRTFDNSCISLLSEEEHFEYIENIVLQYKTGWGLCTKLFKSEIVKTNGILICETCENFAEDLGFFLLYILYCKRIVSINYSGYYYYQRSNSMMQKSKYTIKLNALNEVSYYFYNYLYSHESVYIIKNYYLLHFWLMNDQLQKLYKYNSLSNLPIEISKLKHKSWYKKMARRFVFHYRRLIPNVGKQMAFEYKNLVLYSIHENYKIFCFFSYLHYRFFRLKG